MTEPAVARALKMQGSGWRVRPPNAELGLVLGEALKVVVPDRQPEPGDVAALHGIEQVPVPFDRVHQPDSLALDLGSHERAYLAVQH